MSRSPPTSRSQSPGHIGQPGTSGSGNQNFPMSPQSSFAMAVPTAPLKIEEIDRRDGVGSLKKFERMLECANIVEAREKIGHLIQFLDKQLYDLIDPILEDRSLSWDDKYNQCRQEILAKIQLNNQRTMDNFFKITKKDDSRYEDFLNFLKKFAKDSNITSREVIKKRFIDSIKDAKMKESAIILLKTSQLEETAKSLDEIIDSRDNEICGINRSKIVDKNQESMTEKLIRQMKGMELRLEASEAENKRLQKLIDDQKNASPRERPDRNESYRSVHFNERNSGAQGDRDYSNNHNDGGPRRYNENNDRYNDSRFNRPRHNQNADSNWRERKRNGLCYYHNKFGKNAWRCSPGCLRENKMPPKN